MKQNSRFGVPFGLVIFALASVFIAGCFVRGPKVTRGNDQKLPAGVWSIDGVSLNQNFDIVSKLLGPPEASYAQGSWKVCSYSEGKISVTFDAQGLAMRVSGRALFRDAERVLQSKDPEGRILSLLGAGYVIEDFSPKGSGMITTGSKPNGKRHHFEDDQSRFQIMVGTSGEIGWFSSRRLQDAPGYWN